MSWGEIAPGILGLALLWVLPGYAVLRLLGVRGLVALGGGAAVTSGLSGVLAIGYALVGLRWSLWSFLAGCLLVAVLAALAGRLLGTVSDPAGVEVAGERPLRSWEKVGLAATWVLGGGVLAAAMTEGMGRADQPPQAWDAVFHLNALWFVRETGNASSLGGLAPMYADNVQPFYPAVWHGIVAVAPAFERVTAAANSSSLVIGSVVWIAGLVALTRVVFPTRVVPVVLVPVLAASYVTFPAVAVSMLAVWPFALSVACLPGTIALAIASLRGLLSWQMHLVHGAGLVVAVTGVVLAHPSGLFSLMLLALPLLTVLLARQLRRQARNGSPVLATVVMVGWLVAVVGVIVFLVTFPPVQSIMDYQRGGQDSYWPSAGSLLIDHPLIYVYKITSVNLVGTVLVLLGVALTVTLVHARWLVASLVAAVALTMLAAGPPENPARILAGFWYTQPSRINQLVLVPALVLAAGAGGWLVRLAAARLRAPRAVATTGLVVVLVVLTSGLRWTSQTQVMASTYTTYPIAWGTMLEPEEIEMIDRVAARDTLPDDAVVLGEPVAGSPYLLHRADVQVVFPQLSPIPDSPERDLLAEHFEDWRTMPEVCEAVRALGVTHVYTDSLTFEDELNAKYEESTQGLYNLTAEGPEFELVDRGGHAALWRFTGCDA